MFFSPHRASDRPDLDRLTALAKSATSSRLFMTFRMTDLTLIKAVLDESLPVFGVADRVYQGADGSGDRAIFEDAHSASPRVAACNAPLDDEPDENTLFEEIKRDGYNPLVHHKILLFDWDTPQCVVVTGSANYSANSTAHNDENSLIVHGDQRLAEEYVVEFCRLYTHWRPRWLRERDQHGAPPPEHLASDSSWTGAWAEGGRMAQFLDVATGGQGVAGSAPATHQTSGSPAAQSTATSARPQPASTAAGTGGAGARIQHVVVLMLSGTAQSHRTRPARGSFYSLTRV